jgi:hypothetical protein
MVDMKLGGAAPHVDVVRRRCAIFEIMSVPNLLVSTVGL